MQVEYLNIIFVANLLLSPSVKKVLKSVNIW